MPRATDGPRREQVLVLLDATAAHAHGAALAAYVDAVVGALDDELVVTCQPGDAEHYRRLAPHAVIEAGPASLKWRGIRMLWRQFALPRIARRHDVDAVHVPQPRVPLLLARPRVMTVPRAGDDPVGSGPRFRLRRVALRIAVRAADEIVALDTHSAELLERAVGFAADDVLVLPPAEEVARFAAAHRLAYRSAALLVPSQTGPIALQPLDGQATGVGPAGPDQGP